MELLLLAIAGAFVEWCVEKVLDALERREPVASLTDAQVLRAHRRRFVAVVVLLGWTAVLGAISSGAAIGTATSLSLWLQTLVIVGFASYMLRVTLRRWRRLKRARLRNRRYQ
jgi:hypothetical protein